MQQLQAILGILVIVGVFYVASRDRAAISFKKVAFALSVQFLLAFILLKIPFIAGLLLYANKAVTMLDSVTQRATQFLFGYLAGADAPFAVVNEGAMFLVAYRVLPLIMVVSALSSLLFYWGVLPAVIRFFSMFLMRGFKVSGALGFGAAASLFLGTIEAPLTIRPYIARMTKGELLALLSCTMATIAGTVMILYATILQGAVENPVGHLLTASIISIPAALLLSMMLMPAESSDSAAIKLENSAGGAFDALIRGTLDGLQMVLQIVAVLLVMFALVYLTNDCLALLPIDGAPVTIQGILGLLLQPVVWLVGVPWAETGVAGSLMGTKVILNEFVAYLEMSQLPPEALSPSTKLIMTYACCGFANLGSLGIIVGGLGSLIPERRADLIAAAGLSVIIGNAATLMTAAIVAILV